MVLQNIFPTAEGGELRKGSEKYATIGADCTKFAVYQNATTPKLFVADATKIYDITSPADPDTLIVESVTGQTNGDWSSVQFSAGGGDYLIMVNGADDMLQYDGSAFYPMDADAYSTMPFDAETGTFTVGLVVTGGTSSATATIVGLDDNGATGTLYVKTIAGGPFVNDETITDTSTGSATSNIPSGVGTGTNITGVTTANLEQVWQFKNRLFFTEKNTLSAWYLAPLAVGGAATELPLGSVFTLGGSLLFGATWSLDSGIGLDDVCLFVSTEGEIAVYQGTDPDTAADWLLSGVYRIGRPVNKDGWFKAGGDLAVLTEDGIVPVSAAVQTDRTGIQNSSITAPIEEAWKQYLKVRLDSTQPFCNALWHDEDMLIIGMPLANGEPETCFVSNARTGAWAEYTGWGARCLGVYDSRLFFGSDDGIVFEGYVTGSDNGAAYTGTYLASFDVLGGPAEKSAIQCRATFKTALPYSVQMFANADFDIELPTPWAADTFPGLDVWGTAVWDEGTWAIGAGFKPGQTEWQTVGACGYALAAGLMITSGSTVAPDLEIISLHLQYETGLVMG